MSDEPRRPPPPPVPRLVPGNAPKLVVPAPKLDLPPNPDIATPEGWWLGQARRLAGQLLLILPDHAPLRAMAGDLAGGPIEGLPARLAREADTLHNALVGQGARHPLGGLVRAFQLSPFEIDLLSVALLPELDDRFGDAFAVARGGARRPTLGLAIRVLIGGEVERLRLWTWLYQHDPWRLGLLMPTEPGQPLADRELLPTAALGPGVLGSAPGALSRGATVQLTARPDTTLSTLRPSLSTFATSIVLWSEATGPGAILLPGDRALGREVAEVVAGRVGRPLLRIGPVSELSAFQEAAALAWLLGAVLCLEVARDSTRVSLPDPWKLPFPALILAELGVSVEAPDALAFRKMNLPIPGPAEQAAAWVALVAPTGGQVDADMLGNQTRLPLRTMRAAVQLASVAGTPSHASVVAALASTAPDPTSALASITRPDVSWDSLVLPPRTVEALEGLRTRLSHRATVQDRWGLSGPEGRGDGLVALLHGEPGTGKTLAAEAMATALGLPLMRIDLSRVVSKYIGETEKNLASAFDGAEGFRAVLFFDEADALFSRRTSVSDAHDRYANLETNYLLQRLEAFEGLALLATNALQNLDEAFLRRIPFVIALPRPGRSMQRKLWERHLPVAIRSDDVNLDSLASRYDLVGGEIRSAALGAAYAAAAGEGRVSQCMIETNVRAELQKRGRPVPESG